MRTLRFAMIGAGFWARYQLAGWYEAGGAQCVGIYNRTRAKAEALAHDFGDPRVFDDVEAMLRETLQIAAEAPTPIPLIREIITRPRPADRQKP